MFETYPKASAMPHKTSENQCDASMRSPHDSGGKPEYTSVGSDDRYPQKSLLGKKSTRDSTQMEDSGMFAKGGGPSMPEHYPQKGLYGDKNVSPGGSLDTLVKPTDVKCTPA